MHNIKATAAYFGFEDLQSIAHLGEDLLSSLRNGELDFNEDVTNALFVTIDAAQEIFSEIETHGRETKNDDDQVDQIETLAPRADPKVRIDVEVLDEILEIATELSLIRNQILRYADRPQIHDAAIKIDALSIALRGRVMQARLQPVDSVFRPLNRLARRLADRGGKQVRLELRGRRTELDKSSLEALRRAITHLLRNAVDHGIELPSVRRSCGKPEQGRIECRAFHEGDTVRVEIHDDGRGIDIESVRTGAVALGLLDVEEAKHIDRNTLLELLFAPGFTTAVELTRLSGRGVGLDAVRAEIDAVGGEVRIRSSAGCGTTVHIAVPMSRPLVSALIVESHVDVEGTTVPLRHLSTLLGYAPDDAPTHAIIMRGACGVVALAVDGLEGTEELAPCAFPPVMMRHPLIGGTAVTDAGTVLILDLNADWTLDYANLNAA
nr:chemotaxis protein CheA-like [Nerophis lumbriciformis]